MKQTKNKPDWSKIKYFLPAEFDDPDWSGSYAWMDPKTILQLDQLRGRTGWPIITHNKHGVHGCVCMTKGHHSPNSFHQYDNPNGCSACDFHFGTTACPRKQAQAVLQAGFGSVGIYQDIWRWVDRKGKSYILPIGFHVDFRKHFQIWHYDKKLKESSKDPYVYLLR